MDWKEVLGQLRQDGALPESEDQGDNSEVTPDRKDSPKDTLRLSIDKKGRKGKTAIIVEGFTAADEEVAEVAAKLKKRLGVGGSARGGEILIQGASLDKVSQLLRDYGYKVK